MTAKNQNNGKLLEIGLSNNNGEFKTNKLEMSLFAFTVSAFTITAYSALNGSFDNNIIPEISYGLGMITFGSYGICRDNRE